MPVLRKQDIKGHALMPLKGSYIPTVWLFLDTETEETLKDDITYHHFHVGWTCLLRRATEKRPETEAWTWFLSAGGLNGYIQEIALRYKRIQVVGHNIFFDLQAAGTFTFLAAQGWKLDFYYDRGLTYLLKCSLGEVVMTLVSSTNWFDQSLKSLGKVVGLEKLDIEFGKASPEELKTYCMRDVEILVELFKYYFRFIQDNEMGSLGLTKASQAFKAFRYRFTDGSIFIHHHAEVHALERAAYMGGRVECFFIGHCQGGPFVSLDVNSMYPFVMKEFEYPVKLLRVDQSPSIKFIKEVIVSYGVIAEVELETEAPAYALRKNHKTIFPIGRFTTCLCTEGLKYAFKHGHVKKIHQASIYKMADIFTEYVDFIHSLRQKYLKEKNEVMALLAKYMHNALYGKFAQLEIINEKEDIDSSAEYSREVIFNLVTGHNLIVTRMMNTQITQRTGGEGKNSNVAIAAHITENARFYLWDLMNRVGRENVLYCDTDSMKIRRSDLKHEKSLLSKTKLGALKNEGTTNKLYIEGSKNYRTENGRRIKGIPESAKEIVPGTFSYRWFAGQVTHLKKNIPVGARVETLTRTLTALYDKGIIHPDGTVTPLRL